MNSWTKRRRSSKWLKDVGFWQTGCPRFSRQRQNEIIRRLIPFARAFPCSILWSFLQVDDLWSFPLLLILTLHLLSLRFLGDSSAGKSTLINLLLGSELLPASPMPCTSTICEIRYSEQRKAEIHKANTEVEVVELGDAPAKDLLPYLCLEGEERFVLNPYIKVVVHFPAPLLKVNFLCF